MRPDLANTGLIEITDNLIAFRYRADRVVHNQCRPDIVSLENRLHLPQRLDRSNTGGAPRRDATQSNSASVSTTTVSIGCCAAGQATISRI